MKRLPRERQDKAGFTLVELLFGILIVLVLSLILAVSLGALQEKASTSRCISNLRNIGSALFASSVDNNGMAMPKVATPNVQWQAAIDPYLGGTGAAGVVTTRMWACRENKALNKALDLNGRGQGAMTGYPMNRHLTIKTEDEKWSYGVKMASVRNPSGKVYVIESCNAKGAFGPATTMAYTPYGYKEWMKQVHPEGNGVLFCDGHVEMVRDTHDLCSTTVAVARPWWNIE